MKDNKLILDKIKKVLDTNELKTFNKAIKEMVKESTEKNIATIKKEYETKSEALITEAKETMEADNTEIIAELVAEEIAELINKEKSKQKKLIKENKKLTQSVATLNKNVSDLKQSMKIKQNQITSMEKETKDEVVNEGLVIDGVDLSKLITGVHGNETTTMNQVNKNLSNDSLHGDVVSMIASMKNI